MSYKVLPLLMAGLILSTLVFASEKQTIAVIDAGSSGSRLYAYEYRVDPQGTQPLQIKEVFNKRHPGNPLHEIVTHPKETKAALLSLLTQSATALRKNGISERVRLYLFATGGMRTLSPKQQQAIYRQLRKQVKEPTFKWQSAQTLSGQHEAVFGWLAANELTQKLGQSTDATFGYLDLGGASFEIAYAHHHPTVAENLKICIQAHCYNLYAISLQGAGLLHMIEGMKTNEDAKFCYPTNFQYTPDLIGHYHYALCLENTKKQTLDKLEKMTLAPPPEKMSFIATAGIFYTFDFFNAKSSLRKLERNTIENCEHSSWQTMLNENPEEKPDNLSRYCYASTLVKALFETLSDYGFDFQTMPLLVQNQYNHQSISWARGAAIYLIGGRGLNHFSSQ